MTAPTFPAFIKLKASNTDKGKADFLKAVDQTMTAGEARTADFAATAQGNIDKALRVPPGAASTFTAEIDRMVLMASGNLDNFAKSARRNLDAALSGKVTASGTVDLDVAGAREAANVAERRAALARQLAEATKAAALAERDFSQASRLSIAAARELADSEGQAAAAARVQADAAEKLQAAMTRAGITAQTFGAANDNLTGRTAAARQGMLQLGYQIGDAATMFSMGSNASQIFASQLGQTVQAVQLMTGGTSRLAAFLGGPWGIALSTAAIVTAPFVGKLWEIVSGAQAATGALQKLIEKQRQQQAEKSAVPNAQKDIDALVKRRAELEADIAKRGVRNPATGELQFVYRQQQELKQINKDLAEGRQALDNERASAVSLDRIMGDLAGKRLKDAFATEKQTKAKVAKVKADDAEAEAMDRLWRATMQAAKGFNEDLAKSMGKALDKDAEKYWDGVAERQAQALGKLTATAEASAAWNEQLRDTLDILGQIGGAGSALAGIGEIVAGLASGNFRGIGGPAGLLARTIAGAQWVTVDNNGNREIKRLGDEMLSVLDGVFGSRGSFLKVLEGAGLGGAASSVLLGTGGSGFGSMVGGALGQKLGEKFLSKGLESVAKGLGNFAGPLGSIAGGLLGGALGSAFKKTTKGFAVISNKGVTSGGNNSDLARGAANTGDSISAKLTSIAERLGGMVGDYSVSIGTRSSGWISVSASGSSQVADKNWKKRNAGGDLIYDGKDPEEAARIALLNAIQDGAIQGIRSGAQRLLKAGKDLDRQLQRALDFEGVFADLKAYRDPTGAALDTLNLEFRRLIDIFNEAGASTAEMAQLEELYGIKRADAVRDANERILGSLKGLKEYLGVGSDFYSLRDRQAQAEAIYNPLADRVRAGDASAFDAFAKAAQDLLEIERQISGSTGAFFAKADEIRALTDQAIAGKQTVADAAAASDSPFTQLASQQQATVSAIDSQTEALLAALGGINANLVASLRAQLSTATANGSAALTLPARGYW